MARSNGPLVALFTVTVALIVGGGGGGGGGVTMLPPPQAVRVAKDNKAALNASLFMQRILIKPAPKNVKGNFPVVRSW
jgi:hypothetical protein